MLEAVRDDWFGGRGYLVVKEDFGRRWNSAINAGGKNENEDFRMRKKIASYGSRSKTARDGKTYHGIGTLARRSRSATFA